MKKLVLFLLMLFFCFGALSALAQDEGAINPGITPDSPFYFLKVWREKIQTFFTFGAENKAKQYFHLADVRLAEYKKMVEKGKEEIAQRTLEKYQKQLDRALNKIEQLQQNKTDIKDVSQKAEESVAKHIEILQTNLEKAPESAKKRIENAIENSGKVLDRIKSKLVPAATPSSAPAVSLTPSLTTSPTSTPASNATPSAPLAAGIKTKSPVLEFSAGSCDNSMDGYSEPFSGILSQTWDSNGVLVVEGYVKTLCTGIAVKGSYQKNGNNLTLKYKLEHGVVQGDCYCAHRLTYRISNMEKSSYQISLTQTE